MFLLQEQITSAEVPFDLIGYELALVLYSVMSLNLGNS